VRFGATIWIAVVFLAFATPVAVSASSSGPAFITRQAMQVLDGVWTCRQQIIGSTTSTTTLSIAPANETQWMHASIVDPGNKGRPSHEELLWSYGLTAHAWTMYVVADGEKGEFAGGWWQGNTFTWHGSMQEMLAGHFHNREIVWTRRGQSGLDWNEYDMFADGSRLLYLLAVCTRH
jgi:hypothetical protein